MNDLTPSSSVHASLSSWFKDPKTWITAVILTFTLGGSVTVFRDNLQANYRLIEETNKVVLEHQSVTMSVAEAQKASTDVTQQLLKELVRVTKIQCFNSAKDDASRRVCAGVDH